MIRRQTPTLEQFKQFSADVAPAARAVLVTRAHAQLVRARVDAYIRPIFDSYAFVYGALGAKCGCVGLIPDVKEIYLADDGPMVDAFFADCDKAHRAHGFKGQRGYCPALIAEHQVIEVENALIELAEPLFGIECHDLSLEDRAEYLRNLMGAALKAWEDAGLTHSTPGNAVLESLGTSQKVDFGAIRPIRRADRHPGDLPKK